MEFDNLQTINQLNKTINELNKTINELNKTIQILQKNITTKDATIIALKQTIDGLLDETISTKEPPMVIVVPSSDEINNHRGKVLTVTQNFYFFQIKTRLRRKYLEIALSKKLVDKE